MTAVAGEGGGGVRPSDTDAPGLGDNVQARNRLRATPKALFKLCINLWALSSENGARERSARMSLSVEARGQSEYRLLGEDKRVSVK